MVRVQSVFVFDFSRVFCQGATIPNLHHTEIETFVQTGFARVKEIVITSRDVQNGGAEKSTFKKGAPKYAQGSVAHFGSYVDYM